MSGVVAGNCFAGNSAFDACIGMGGPAQTKAAASATPIPMMSVPETSSKAPVFLMSRFTVKPTQWRERKKLGSLSKTPMDDWLSAESRAARAAERRFLLATLPNNRTRQLRNAPHQHGIALQHRQPIGAARWFRCRHPHCPSPGQEPFHRFDRQQPAASSPQPAARSTWTVPSARMRQAKQCVS